MTSLGECQCEGETNGYSADARWSISQMPIRYSLILVFFGFLHFEYTAHVEFLVFILVGILWASYGMVSIINFGKF